MYDDFNRQFFSKLCSKYGLPQDKQIRKFSTGMKAKMRVLTALSHNAKLIIMDEPTAGMDVEARNEILDTLRSYLEKREDSLVLITSHIASDLEGLCDDIYLIHNGKIILHEDTDVILSDYGVLKVDEGTFQRLDKQAVLCYKKEDYGYRCLTNQKKFYLENYPRTVIEKCGIDDLILLLTGGKEYERFDSERYVSFITTKPGAYHTDRCWRDNELHHRRLFCHRIYGDDLRHSYCRHYILRRV